MNNLQIAFPEKSKEELRTLSKESLRHFCDMFIEMIMSMGMSKSKLEKRFTCTNLDELNAFAKAETPTIAMFGHQASYEWTMALQDQLVAGVYAIYKPLKNKYFDKLIRDIRKKFGAEMLAMNQASRKMSQSNTGRPIIYALVADQSPSNYRAQNFTTFFNKTSAVFKGAEKTAKEQAAPVFFLQVRKIKRGYYESTFILICEDGSKTPEWFITDTFFDLLEAQIRKQPEYYLWTHKRWKITPENATRAFELSPRVLQ